MKSQCVVSLPRYNTQTARQYDMKEEDKVGEEEDRAGEEEDEAGEEESEEAYENIFNPEVRAHPALHDESSPCYPGYIPYCLA